MTFKLEFNKANKILFISLGTWLILRFFIFGSSIIYPIVGSGLIAVVIFDNLAKRENK